MSLGDYTKCDLSYGLAKLDITAIEKQLTTLLVMLANNMRDILSPHSIVKTDFKEQVSSFSCTGSRSLMLLSKHFAETAEVLHTIQESNTREIECVNLLEN